MKIPLPGGVIKDIKPTTCNVVEQNGVITCCLVLDFEITTQEALRIKAASELELNNLQNPNTNAIDEKQMFIDEFSSVINP